jgi:hypothetical protein
MGVRFVENGGPGRHAWLGCNPDMRKNIEAANFVATLRHFSQYRSLSKHIKT